MNPFSNLFAVPPLPKPVFQPRIPAPPAFEQHIRNLPVPEPPGKLRRLAAALAGVGEAYNAGPQAGISTVQNILYEPYNRALQEYVLKGQGLLEAEKLRQQQRLIDIEESSRQGALQAAQQKRLDELNKQAYNQWKDQFDRLKFFPTDTGVSSIDPVTGEVKNYDLSKMSDLEKMLIGSKLRMEEAKYQAGLNRQGDIFRHLLSSTNKEPKEIPVSLREYIDQEALRRLAVKYPEEVGRVLVPTGNKFSFIPESQGGLLYNATQRLLGNKVTSDNEALFKEFENIRNELYNKLGYSPAQTNIPAPAPAQAQANIPAPAPRTNIPTPAQRVNIPAPAQTNIPAPAQTNIPAPILGPSIDINVKTPPLRQSLPNLAEVKKFFPEVLAVYQDKDGSIVAKDNVGYFRIVKVGNRWLEY